MSLSSTTSRSLRRIDGVGCGRVYLPSTIQSGLPKIALTYLAFKASVQIHIIQSADLRVLRSWSTNMRSASIPSVERAATSGAGILP